MATATVQQRDIQERIRRGDLTGLNFAGLVRLSFERKSKKKANQQRPSFYMTGEDINKRETQEERCRNYVEAHGGRYVYTYDEPDTSAWKRKRVVNPDGTVSWEVIRPRFDEMIKCMQRIREGIAEALRDGSTIDHETAWLIAKHITPGSGALHELAMTGEITPEIGTQLEIAYELLPELADSWIAALDGYCFRRRDKGAVPGWPETS